MTLFTMGCPLRDLYGLRFPRLYGWTRDSGDPVMKPLPADLERDPQRAPAPLGLYAVKHWVNAYRSGDYIGRYLWRRTDDRNTWDVTTVMENSPKSLEFCIGAGSHTHYWDVTAPAIAYRLDALIAQAGADVRDAHSVRL